MLSEEDVVDEASTWAISTWAISCKGTEQRIKDNNEPPAINYLVTLLFTEKIYINYGRYTVAK